jgi:hypothetical protein
LRRIPWKSIALALFLLILGSSLLFLSYFISTGHMEGDSSQVYGLLFLGILSFLPGTFKYTTSVVYWDWYASVSSSSMNTVLLKLFCELSCIYYGHLHTHCVKNSVQTIATFITGVNWA